MSTSDATEPGAMPEGGRGPGVPIRARPGDTLGGRFLLRQVLGSGGTGTVFAALDTAVGQKVAIKLLHPDLHDATTRERLRREVRAARHGHPNLVAVYDLHEDAGQLWLSMELVEGESLKQRLAERSRLEPDEAADVGRQVAGALEHLHGLGLVHRDVKPGNVLLAHDGTAKLCDMGLTRPLEQGTTLTQTEMVVGTPAYMAPEQGLGRELTAASDVYGLGMTLYQALTGSVPLTSETAVATLTRRQREAPPPVRRARPDAPRWLGRLLARMLRPLPADRPSAAAVRRGLETRRVWPRPRRRAVVAAAAAGALIAAAALAAALVLQRETVRFEVAADAVHGLDKDGRRTWTHRLPAPVRSSLEADLDGDGSTELVVAGWPDQSTLARSTTQITSFAEVLTTRGAVQTRLVPEEMVTSWAFPFRIELIPVPHVLDLDADGTQELLLICNHAHFYPSALAVYWPRWGRWVLTLLHPGHLTVLGAGSASGRPGIRFVAPNNLLGYTPVYGEIELVPPDEEFGKVGEVRPLGSPPHSGLSEAPVGAWRAYIPIDETLYGMPHTLDRITARPDGSVALSRSDGRGFELDRFGNPVPGPNAGQDLRAVRAEFMNSLSRFRHSSTPITSAGARTLFERVQAASAPVLDELPYQLILAMVGARARAAAGDLQGAIALLKTAAERQEDEDLLYLQANLLAIAGELDSARAAVLQLIDTGRSSRSHFDGIFLALGIAANSHDRETVSALIDLIGREGTHIENQHAIQNSLVARARLWWDESTGVDCELASSPLVGDGDALGCLARWRLGRSGADDVELMSGSIELNPDGAALGRVALAAAYLASELPQSTLSTVETAIRSLEPTAKYDFIDFQSLALARALQAVALAEAGEHERATALASELAREQPGDVLPGILAREVLARSAS